MKDYYRHLLSTQPSSGTALSNGTIMPMRQLPIPPPERKASVSDVSYPVAPYGYPAADSSDEDDEDDAPGTLFKEYPMNGAQPFDNKNAFTRPPPELVYDRLDEYFKEHDLDRPVIEATSGGTSPTSTDLPPLPVLHNPPVDGRFKHKKSIRVVADEHKRRIKNRMSTATPSDMRHKRSTKLWGSKLEEVTAQMLASGASGGSDAPESPTTAPKRMNFFFNTLLVTEHTI
jgi:hypothetical protein